VVGWEWHLSQRGQDVAEIKARFSDLETLYAGRDRQTRREILDRYRAGWIVLASLERETYGLERNATLEDIPGVVKLAGRDGAALFRVVPAESAAPVEPGSTANLPPGMRLVGRLQRPGPSVARSLHLDEEGALATLAGGEIVSFNPLFEPAEDLPAPPCAPLSSARFEGRVWALCADGGLQVLVSGAWRPSGSLPGAIGLAADRALWAWGPAGLWQIEGASSRRVAAGPVTAAAANGVFVAWSDGASTWIGTADRRPPHVVLPELGGVRALAWQGPKLWAIDDQGLHSSGGGVLRWRPFSGAPGAVDLIAGSSEALLLVVDDGSVLEYPSARCPSPWTPSSGASSSGLDQPRGIAVSQDGWFAVVDTMNHRLRWYSDAGVCLDEFGRQGSGDRSFSEPSGLDLADDGRLAVADTWNGRIQILRPDGGIDTVARGLFGPREVLWTAGGSLLVSDTGNKRVLRLSAPDWNPEVVAELPAPVVGLAPVGGLLAVASPAAGSVFIVDPTTGSTVRSIDVPGWSSGEQQEGYLVTLPSGQIAASAPKPGEIWALDPSAAAAPRLLRDGVQGVTDMAVRSDGRLLASLTWDHRLIRIDLDDGSLISIR
jgi:hypothetical protein